MTGLISPSGVLTLLYTGFFGRNLPYRYYMRHLYRSNQIFIKNICRFRCLYIRVLYFQQICFIQKLLMQNTRYSHKNRIHKKVTAGDPTRPAYFRVGQALHSKARRDLGPHCLNFVFYALLKTYFPRKPHLIEFKTKTDQ